MAKFLFGELINSSKSITTRLGSGTAQSWDDKEVGKFVKFVGDSRYDLCAAGDPIEGVVKALDASTQDNYSMGSIAVSEGPDAPLRKEVTFDGLQASPGTGTIAIGDYVVCGTVVAKGTALSVPPKVCKATNQPFATQADLAGAAAAAKVATFAWRVVSLGSGGVGTVGGTGIIERVL